MKPQVDLLRKADWDILIVLDACRWDYWNDMYGVGEPVRSPSSCTRDWIRTIRDELDWSDVSCITANPVITYYGNFLDEVYDVGEVSHRKINGVPTVPPEDVISSLRAKVVLSDDRIYCHFIQPHGPYPWSDPPLYLHRARPESEELVEVGEIIGKGISSVPGLFEIHEDVTWETVKDGYRKNLEWVYDSIIDFSESIESTVVITSDHGEYLGEDDRYGHDCKYDSDIVKVVPWYEV